MFSFCILFDTSDAADFSTEHNNAAAKYLGLLGGIEL